MSCLIHGEGPALAARPIGSPLFIISMPELVIAQCTAGIVGSMPALNARPAEQLDEWLPRSPRTLAAHDRAHPDRPAAPFAINQIVHKSNDRLEHDLAVCAKYKVPIVITSLGARTEVNEAVHGYGGIVLHDVINDAFAQKAIEKGADGLSRSPPAPAAMPASEPVRADAGDPRMVRRPAGALRRDRHRRRRPRRRRPWAPTSPISARPSSPRKRRAPPRLQADDRRHRARRHRLHATSSPACTATT